MRGHHNSESKNVSTSYVITLEDNDIRNSCICFVPEKIVSRFFNHVFNLSNSLLTYSLGVIYTTIRLVSNFLGIGNSAAKAATTLAIGAAL